MGYIHLSIENTRKSSKIALVQAPGKIFGPCHGFRLKYIRSIYPKFDEDRESVSCFDCSSTVEELSTNFWSTSGKFEFSNCLKVKSDLCSPHSIYQFKHSLSKEEEFIQY